MSETKRLVEAARSSEVDLSRSRLAVRQQDFALRQAQRNLTAARGRLAVLWGDSLQTEYRVTGSVQLDSQVPELIELIALLPNTAYMAQYQGHLLNKEAALTLEKAKAKPDFEVFGGGRYFNEASGESAFVLGVQIPWPLFDKNQGNIRSARAELRGVEHQKAITQRELLLALTNAYQTLVTAHEEATSLQADLLPSAEQTLKESEKAYEQGRFTLLSVLESRTTLFEIREAYLDTLGRYAAAQAQIEALTRPASIQ
jgi:cobalt-zinc-cadmium efflux system outer membrane protein